MLLKPEQDSNSLVIPDGLYTTKAETVGNDFKKKALAKIMKSWTEWEKEAEDIYQELVSYCVANCQADAHFFSKLVMGVCTERQFIHCLNSSMSISNYDIVEAEHIAENIL